MIVMQPAFFIDYGGGPCFFLDPGPMRHAWTELEEYLVVLPTRWQSSRALSS